MPKMTERERLAKIEADQRNLAEEAVTVRTALRAQYAAAIVQLPVECLSEREFRDIVIHAIRVGGAAGIVALKALPASDGTLAPTPARRTSDPHGSPAPGRTSAIATSRPGGAGTGTEPGG
jgi:hypothetical protein